MAKVSLRVTGFLAERMVADWMGSGNSALLTPAVIQTQSKPHTPTI